MQFVEAYAQPNQEGLWGVVVRWREGDPVEWSSVSTALNAADEACRLGDHKVADALRSAAEKAKRNQSNA